MLGTAEMVDISATELLETCQVKKQHKTRGILGETASILREGSLVRQRLLRTSEVAVLKKAGRSLLPKQIRQSLKQQIEGNARTSQSQAAPEEEKPMRPMSSPTVQFYAAKTRVCIDKAKRMLGYQPAFDLESSMSSTKQWAGWANLLGA